MNLGLENKTALVCASTSGLGLATAKALAAEGAKVIITGRSQVRASETAAAVPNAIGIGCDLVADGGAEDLHAAATATLGSIDILVLNGPGPAPGTAEHTTSDGITEAFNTLVIPQQKLVQLSLPAMRHNKWGRVLSISSTSVQSPIPNLSLSNLGRAALAGYLKTLAPEVAIDGITVNMLLPGRIATPRAAQIDQAAAQLAGNTITDIQAASQAAIPAGRYGAPDEFGATATFLCSTQASYITGTALRCDGGMTQTL
jgi:3-oxoacyl-[acyl-carrier protein] reductase